MLCVVTSAVDEGKPQNTFEEIAACAHLASRHPERALGELKAYYDIDMQTQSTCADTLPRGILASSRTCRHMPRTLDPLASRQRRMRSSSSRKKATRSRRPVTQLPDPTHRFHVNYSPNSLKVGSIWDYIGLDNGSCRACGPTLFFDLSRQGYVAVRRHPSSQAAAHFNRSSTALGTMRANLLYPPDKVTSYPA